MVRTHTRHMHEWLDRPGASPWWSSTEGLLVDPTSRHLESVAASLNRPAVRGSPDLAGFFRLSACGDEAVFAQLYDATSARIYGLAVRLPRPGSSPGRRPRAPTSKCGGPPAGSTPTRAARSAAMNRPSTARPSTGSARPRPPNLLLIGDHEREPGPSTMTRPPTPRRRRSRPGGCVPRSPASPKSSARRSRSRTTAATRTRKWPRRSTSRFSRAKTLNRRRTDPVAGTKWSRG